MSATGFTPVYIYSSSTGGNIPAAANLTNTTLGSELAINITDGYLYYKDNANAVQKIGYKLVPIANGGTNNTVFTAKSGNVAGLVFFDGTKLVNDATVTDVGYDTSTNTFQANAATVANNITTTSGNVVIGTSGKGIDFSATPGTGTSELLADYEEGTWTPGYANWASAPTTVYATYRKIGNFVSVSLYAQDGNNNNAGSYYPITGLPYTNSSTSTSAGSMVASDFTSYANCSVPPSGTQIEWFLINWTGKYWRLTLNYYT